MTFCWHLCDGCIRSLITGINCDVKYFQFLSWKCWERGWRGVNFGRNFSVADVTCNERCTGFSQEEGNGSGG